MSAKTVVHLADCWTWAGLRGWCSITHPYLPFSDEIQEVTCQQCLDARAAHETAVR